MATGDRSDHAPDAGGGWIDVSRPLRASTPVWPGDRPFELDQRRDTDFVLSSFATTCHVGTHLDAPLHFDPSGDAVEAVPLNRLIGAAEVVHLRAPGRALTPADLPRGWVPAAERVLLRTDSYPLDGVIDRSFSGLAPDLVHWLADRDVVVVGIDTPSVDVFGSGSHPAHHALLIRGLTWIEGLWLADVKPGLYHLVALPMLLEGAEAAPLRAILKPSKS